MIEPSKMNITAKNYEDENIKFRRFLKNRADPDELDKHFLELHNELFADYDCCKCSNCCKAYSTELDEDEIDDGKCEIYECAPTSCIGFPYTNKPERLKKNYQK